MSVVMIMKWQGVTKEQYHAVRKLVNWEGNLPVGGQFHIAAFDAEGARITDLWESAETFNNFVINRLNPGVEQIGLQGQPEVEIYPVEALFTPAYVEVSKLETA
jgi:hypothetical protein